MVLFLFACFCFLFFWGVRVWFPEKEGRRYWAYTTISTMVNILRNIWKEKIRLKEFWIFKCTEECKNNVCNSINIKYTDNQDNHLTSKIIEHYWNSTSLCVHPLSCYALFYSFLMLFSYFAFDFNLYAI